MEEKLKGLSTAPVNASKEKYGTNVLAKKEKESILEMFLESFKDIWVLVLCGALIIKVVLAIVGYFVPALGSGEDVFEIISILIAIILTTGFSTISEWKNSSRAEALQEEYNKTFA